MCEIPNSRLIAWVDGEIEDAALGKHVAGCASCSGEVRKVRALSETVVEYGRAMARPAGRRAQWWIPVAAAAAILIFAAGLLSLGKPPAPVTAHRSVAADLDQPGILLVVPVDQILPVGAAPRGAVLVQKLNFAAGPVPGQAQFQ